MPRSFHIFFYGLPSYGFWLLWAVPDFLAYRPSEIAAAAVLCASGENTETMPSFYDVVSKVTCLLHLLL